MLWRSVTSSHLAKQAITLCRTLGALYMYNISALYACQLYWSMGLRCRMEATVLAAGVDPVMPSLVEECWVSVRFTALTWLICEIFVNSKELITTDVKRKIPQSRKSLNFDVASSQWVESSSFIVIVILVSVPHKMFLVMLWSFS